MSTDWSKNRIAKYLKFSKWAIALLGLMGFSYIGNNSLPLGVIFLIGSGYLFYDRRKRLSEWQTHSSDILSEIEADKEARKKANAEAVAQIKQTKSILANYEVGLPNYSFNGSYTISSAQAGLTFKKTFGKDQIVIPWEDLLEVEAGSEADLRNRVTVTRLMLVGVFAFGLKKEKKKGFYVSIATKNDLGLFNVNTSGKNNRENEKIARNFAISCNARIRQVNPEGTKTAIANSESKYSEIEKLGELLEKGLITQAEFESQKAKLLN